MSRRPPSYKESHWGLPPLDSFRGVIQEPRDNDARHGGTGLIALGYMLDVSYLTAKGSDPPLPQGVIYDHAFSRRNPPILAYGSVDGRLYVVGGTYRITRHGIIG